jgi:hypothetical protein
MTDVASGSADKSIQVKLVLLGRPLFRFPPQDKGHPCGFHLPSPRLLTATVTQAKLPLANLLSSFALYVVSHRVTIISLSLIN